MASNYIKSLREAQELSRAEFSKRSGVSKRTLESWENGHRIPRDIYQLKKVADVLGCSIEELINWDDLPEK